MPAAMARWYSLFAAPSPASPRSAKMWNLLRPGGNLHPPRPAADTPAHAGTLKILPPARLVSIPSPIPNSPSSPIRASMTTPDDGPRHFFGSGIGALLEQSSVRNVLWIPPVGAPVIG